MWARMLSELLLKHRNHLSLGYSSSGPFFLDQGWGQTV